MTQGAEAHRLPDLVLHIFWTVTISVGIVLLVIGSSFILACKRKPELNANDHGLVSYLTMLLSGEFS